MSVEWVRAFPRSIAPSVGEACLRLPSSEFEHPGFITESNSRAWPRITINGDTIEIPYRIYNRPLTPTEWTGATAGERTILACMYSRHHDGRVRQRVLPGLLDSGDSFVAPFLVQLLGEYVLEIIVEIAHGIERGRAGRPDVFRLLIQFAEENPNFIALTEARARSYWAEYYRREFLWARDYPGLIALSRIAAP